MPKLTMHNHNNGDHVIKKDKDVYNIYANYSMLIPNSKNLISASANTDYCIQWNLRNKTITRAMKSGRISEKHNSCIHGFVTKPKQSYF